MNNFIKSQENDEMEHQPETSGLSLSLFLIQGCFDFELLQENISLEQYLKEIDKKSHSQPFILALGGSPMSPQQVFVVFERKALQQPSLIKALDVCFKLYFVCDLQYQDKCYGAWEFLEAVVYSMKGNVKSSAIRDFRAFCTSKM